VPDEVDRAYAGRRVRYGSDYIIPAPFDPRLIVAVPKAVAKAAMESGVARKPIEDLEAYEHELAARLDPTAASLQGIFDRVRENPRRVVFAEGEEEVTIRAAHAFRNAGYGAPILVGRAERIRETMGQMGIPDGFAEIHNARLSANNQNYTDHLYARHQRKGRIQRDCQRMVNQNRNVFAACMVALGHADAMVTGLTRSFGVAFEDISRVLDPKPGHRVFGMSIMVLEGRSLFVADTSVHEIPTPEELADIAIQSAAQARAMGHEPRVALLSFSNFGNPMRERAERLRATVKILDSLDLDFEYDGEMQANVALDYELMRRLYPFVRLSGPANVLVMPALHSANITAKLVQTARIGTVIGPILIGLSKPAQIVQLGATVNDVVTAAAISAHDSIMAGTLP
jgi:malate dehydrogenase (oxaloacetate-decarboxylating)(NADP+)